MTFIRRLAEIKNGIFDYHPSNMIFSYGKTGGVNLPLVMRIKLKILFLRKREKSEEW